MSTAQWQELERIFAEARQLPADARVEFIKRACGADDALQSEALSLLKADAASGEFMNSPAIERLARAMASDGPGFRGGETIGPYTILELLGAGGSGEVWRARDERIGRDVAIKVFRPHFAGDTDRLSRFVEEARTAGALNHSNIVTVYDVGEHHGIPYLVSECLGGKSLRQRLDAGSVSVSEALTIALGLARGLAAAHASSIVHRDLKPENAFLKSDSGVKILDFGLAKLQRSLEGVGSGSSHTMPGVIVGTAGYTAPEQLKGEDVDARADVFSLGVILYEMLAGEHPFRRTSTFETLHAVLTVDPPDVSGPNPRVPVALNRIVMRLLEKSPGARFQTAVDVIWALEQVAADIAVGRNPTGARSATGSWASQRALSLALLVVSVVLLAAGWALFPWADRDPALFELTRFTWPLPGGMRLGSTALVSPDSRYIAFVGIGGSSPRDRHLYVRDRRSAPSEVIRIEGTQGAQHPFWSPDSASLGFFAGGRLMKVAWRGGAPVAVAGEALFPFGAAWSPSGTIVFAPDVMMAALRRVGESGNRVEPATLLDASLGETLHSWPTFLPDGKHFLYFVRSAQDEHRGTYVGRIDMPASPARSMLLRSDANVIYVPLPGAVDGALLYVADGRVEARRFDPNTLMFTGDPRTIAGVSAAGTTLTSAAMLSASADVLAFAMSTVTYENSSRLEAVDRSGRRLRIWDTPEAQYWPRLSPDGRLLARQRVDELRNTPDVWVEDLERGTQHVVTTALEPDIRPVWSPDGRHLAYTTGGLPYRPGRRVLNIAAADGTGIVRTLPCPGEYCEPTDWTPRGLLVNVIAGQRTDIWVVSTEEGGYAQPLLADGFNERDARMSRDGRWIAYVSDESGRAEVSVRTVSGPAQRFVVSGDGGDHPVWRRDGAELFIVDPTGQLRSVSVRWSRDGVPSFGLPSKLNVPAIGRGHWGTPYDVSADGSRIYFLRRNDDPSPGEIHVVVGWRALLERP